jgi:hypothetical protein
MPIDTTNKFMTATASVAGVETVMLLSPPTRNSILSREEALTFAAWLVVAAGAEGSPSFGEVLAAVENS